MTNLNSQIENWNEQSNDIVELQYALSNIGFLIVGIFSVILGWNSMLKKIFSFIIFLSLNSQMQCFAAAEEKLDTTSAKNFLQKLPCYYRHQFSVTYVLGSEMHAYAHVVDFVSRSEDREYQQIESLLRGTFERLEKQGEGIDTHITAVIVVRGSEASRPNHRENSAYIGSIVVLADEERERTAFLEIAFYSNLSFAYPAYAALFFEPMTGGNNPTSLSDSESESESSSEDESEFSSSNSTFSESAITLSSTNSEIEEVSPLREDSDDEDSTSNRTLNSIRSEKANASLLSDFEALFQLSI